MKEALVAFNGTTCMITKAINDTGGQFFVIITDGDVSSDNILDCLNDEIEEECDCEENEISAFCYQVPNTKEFVIDLYETVMMMDFSDDARERCMLHTEGRTAAMEEQLCDQYFFMDYFYGHQRFGRDLEAKGLTKSIEIFNEMVENHGSLIDKNNWISKLSEFNFPNAGYNMSIFMMESFVLNLPQTRMALGIKLRNQIEYVYSIDVSEKN